MDRRRRAVKLSVSGMEGGDLGAVIEKLAVPEHGPGFWSELGQRLGGPGAGQRAEAEATGAGGDSPTIGD